MHVESVAKVSQLISSADGSALNEEFARRIVDTRALLEGHFLLQSGLHCMYFLRTSQLLYRRADGELFARALAVQARALAPKRLVALESASAFLARPLAAEFGIELAMVKVDQRKRPTPELASGDIVPGERVVIVADHVTTSTSFDAVSSVVEGRGATAVGGAALSVLGSNWLAGAGRVALLKALWKVETADKCAACAAGEPLWPAYEFA